MEKFLSTVRRTTRPALHSLQFLFDALQQIVGVVVVDLGLIVDYVVVSGLKQLLAAVAQLLADELLHAGIVELSLSGGLFGN
jgi:hypothetical protein